MIYRDDKMKVLIFIWRDCFCSCFEVLAKLQDGWMTKISKHLCDMMLSHTRKKRRWFFHSVCWVIFNLNNEEYMSFAILDIQYTAFIEFIAFVFIVRLSVFRVFVRNNMPHISLHSCPQYEHFPKVLFDFEYKMMFLHCFDLQSWAPYVVSPGEVMWSFAAL